MMKLKVLASKMAQLGWVEFKYWFVGFFIGIILTLVAVWLSNHGILIPFKMNFLCAATK